MSSGLVMYTCRFGVACLQSRCCMVAPSVLYGYERGDVCLQPQCQIVAWYQVVAGSTLYIYRLSVAWLGARCGTADGQGRRCVVAVVWLRAWSIIVEGSLWYGYEHGCGALVLQGCRVGVAWLRTCGCMAASLVLYGLRLVFTDSALYCCRCSALCMSQAGITWLWAGCVTAISSILYGCGLGDTWLQGRCCIAVVLVVSGRDLGVVWLQAWC